MIVATVPEATMSSVQAVEAGVPRLLSGAAAASAGASIPRSAAAGSAPSGGRAIHVAPRRTCGMKEPRCRQDIQQNPAEMRPAMRQGRPDASPAALC
jgi:hypothetical protein